MFVCLACGFDFECFKSCLNKRRLSREQLAIRNGLVVFREIKVDKNVINMDPVELLVCA